MECLRCGAPLTNSLCICGMNHTGYPNKLRMGELEPDCIRVKNIYKHFKGNSYMVVDMREGYIIYVDVSDTSKVWRRDIREFLSYKEGIKRFSYQKYASRDSYFEIMKSLNGSYLTDESTREVVNKIVTVVFGTPGAIGKVQIEYKYL